MDSRGFYFIRDQFFVEHPDPYLMHNKNERRPHYYAFTDAKTGLDQVIPMTSVTEKYERIINSYKQQNKRCDLFYICTLDNGRKNTFLLQDMFPIKSSDVAGSFMLSNADKMTLTSDSDANNVEASAKRMLNLIRRGKRFSKTTPDALKIEQDLLQKSA